MRYLTDLYCIVDTKYKRTKTHECVWKGGRMQKFYFNNIPAIVNIDDGEDEQTTINTIIDILEDAGYEFEEEVEE